MLAGLDSMVDRYGDRTDLEVVIVDDGSPTDPALPALERWTPPRVNNLIVRCYSLPVKSDPKNPCTPINHAVRHAAGDLILLTNPETVHPVDVLSEMVRQVSQDPFAYVLASAYCPESGTWYCHPDYAPAGYHFCGLLSKDLFWRAGGFDEDYREGHCFDDPDFVQRLLRAGAKITLRDDLIVLHRQIESPSLSAQPHANWLRNHRLFWEKWPSAIAIDGSPLTEARLQNRP
jgi:hypothetical protein